MKNSKLSFIINIVIAAVLSAGAVLFPYASWIIMAVTAVFFAINCYRYDAISSSVLTVVSLAAILSAKCYTGITIDNIATAASTFCLTALNGAVIGWLTKGKSDFRMVITGGTLVNLASFVIEFALFKFHHGLDLMDELINKPIAEFFTVYNEILTQTGVENAEAIIGVMDDLQWAMQQMLATVTPSILILFSAAFAYVVFLIGRKLIFRRYSIVMEYPHFWQLQFPRYMSAILAVLFVITMFMSSSPLAGAITNIIIIFCGLYFVCGLSVVDFFFKRKKNMHWIARIIIYITGFIVLSIIGMILPFANITTLLLFLGVIDGMADFRKLRSGGERYEE